jgi:SAUR family protein
MDMVVKAWRRYTTLPKQTSSKGCIAPRSWTSGGCFSVYVGPEKQRFVVKAEFTNHPSFKVLLEEAALEYGYQRDGPILLPCDVDLFYNVLAEIESNTIDYDMITSEGPARHRHSNSSSNKDYVGAYRLLSPSPLLNFNQF